MIISRRLAKNGWRPWHVFVAGGLTAASLAVTAPSWLEILRLALLSQTASHVLLVPCVVVWLVWVRRRRVQMCRPGFSTAGLIIAAVGAACYVYGVAGPPTDLAELGWRAGGVLLPLGCFLVAAGTDVLRRFLPAVLIIPLMIPLPDAYFQAAALPVQVASVEVARYVLEWLGYSAVLRGPTLIVEGVEVTIAEGGRGLPMLLALFLVSYAFAFGSPLRGSARAVILLVTPLSAVLCNGLGLVSTVWLYGGQLDAEQADALNRMSGWILLPLAFLALIAVVRLLVWLSLPIRQFTLAYEN